MKARKQSLPPAAGEAAKLAKATRFRMSQNQDYYRLLGIPREAPEREVKKAYYNLARQLHPDKASSAEEAKANSDKLAYISQAYNTLKDEKKRADYDATLSGKPTAPAPSPSIAGGRVPTHGGAGTVPQSGSAPAGGGAQTPGTPEAARRSSNEVQAQKVAMAQKAFVRGMQHFKLSEWDKARPFFEAAIQNDPDSEPHYFNKYAICLTRSKGGFTKAVDAAQRAVDMDSYNLEFKLTLGEVYEGAGVPSKAKAVYEEVLRWDAENGKAKARLLNLAAEAHAKQPFLEKLMPSIFGKKK